MKGVLTSLIMSLDNGIKPVKAKLSSTHVILASTYIVTMATVFKYTMAATCSKYVQCVCKMHSDTCIITHTRPPILDMLTRGLGDDKKKFTSVIKCYTTNWSMALWFTSTIAQGSVFGL